jgi:hypothetical protein
VKNEIKIAAGLLFLILASGFGACTPKTTQTSPTTEAPEKLSMLSAVLSEITGKVEIKQAGQVGFTPAHADSFLNENGQVQTGDDGRVRLNLSTGTIVRVAPASLFTLASNKQSDGELKTKFELTLGQLFIILNGGSMEVDTPTGTAAVRGSYMSVSYDPTTREVRVTCLEGHCSLAGTSGSVDITAGQTAIITLSGQPPQVGEMSDQDIQNWLNNNPEAKLVLPAPTDEPLATEPPVATDAPPTETPPTEAPPPLVYVPPVIMKKPVEDPPPAPIPTVPTAPVPTKTPTQTIITSQTPYPSLVNMAVVFTATVDSVPFGVGLPTGSVTFSDGTDSCTVTSAPWSCSITFTNSGPRIVTASYSGDANFNGSSSATVTQDVLFSANSEFLNVTGPISITLLDNSECSQPYSVKVLDVDGILDVKMEYSINDNTFTTPGSVLLTNMGANIWQGNAILPVIGMDIVYWRFIATDGSNNSTFFGGSAPYTDGYPIPAVPVSSFSFNLTSAFTPPCLAQ